MRDLQQELSDKTKNFYEDINKRVFGEDAADSDQDVVSEAGVARMDIFMDIRCR